MERTLFELVGGEDFFEKLVDGFYQGIETDEVLGLMYQGHDLVQARRHLALFLQQYWGGPTTYQSERGHPRLRMRHMPFVIDPDARDRWLDHMQASLAQLEMPLTAREELWNYLVAAANSLVNSE